MLFMKSLLRNAAKRHLNADEWPRPSSIREDDADWTPEYDMIEPCNVGWHFFPYTDDAFIRWANWGEELWLVEIPEEAIVKLEGDKIVANCARLVRQLATRDSILSPNWKLEDLFFMNFTYDEMERLNDGFQWWAALYARYEREPLRTAPYEVADTMESAKELIDA